ncbi:hypothetical protein [Pseudanabaena mucicola]|uniref:hypothetical protein n=1 Tax=Pseudanabaena mucicola TaxID=71190 RepID=UPI00257623BE|nr:hypothetical protein [Pseudanabaena mucicola]
MSPLSTRSIHVCRASPAFWRTTFSDASSPLGITPSIAVSARGLVLMAAMVRN